MDTLKPVKPVKPVKSMERHDVYAALDDGEQRAVVERAISGDEAAFETLYLSKVRLIYYYIHNLIGDVPDIDDIVQEISIRLYNGIGKLRNPDVFSIWMYKIIRNYCYYRQRHLRRMAGEVSFGDYTEDDAGNELAERNVEFLPAEYLEDKDKRDAVLRVVNRQSKKARQLLIMYYFDGLSNKEIALALDMKVSSVTGRLAKIRNKMRDDMEKELRLYDMDERADNRSSNTVLKSVLVSNAALLFPAAKLDVAAGAFHGVIAAHSAAGAAGVVGAAGSGAGAAAGSGTVSAAGGASSGVAGGAGAAQAAGHSIGLTSFITSKVVIIAAAGVIGTSGAAFVASDAGGQWLERALTNSSAGSAAAKSAVSEDAWRKSEIVFKTEGGGYGHDNPVSASIAFPFKVNDYESCSYTIQNKKGVTVASGKGREVTAPFAELIKSGDPGIYQIQFIFKSASGHSVTLKRDFTITNSTAD